MSAVPIPFDEESEMIFAGLGSVGRRTAADVLQRADPSDCYLPKHCRLLEHALDEAVLRAEDRADPLDRLEARLGALAIVAEVDIGYLRELTTDFAAYGRRFSAPYHVRLAKRRRDLMQITSEIYNGSADLSNDELLELLDQVAELRNLISELEQPRQTIDVVGSAA